MYAESLHAINLRSFSYVSGALSQSQFPVFTIYAQKTCLAVKPCERAWCIDRVQGHRLQGHARRTMTASSRQHCLELCLGERDFLCRWVPRATRSISHLIYVSVELSDCSFSTDLLSYPLRRGYRVCVEQKDEPIRRNIRRESVRRGNDGSSSLRRTYAPMHFPLIGFLDQLDDVTLRSHTLSSVSQTWTVRSNISCERKRLTIR